MPIPIVFEKSSAQKLITAIARGDDIPGVNNVNDMLALAGACYFAAMSRAPMLHKELARMQHPEPQEASEEKFFEDLQAAIGFYGQLYRLLKDKRFDAHFCDTVRAVVWRDTDGGTFRVQPVEGFKDQG
jgi:hypothetical protein